MKPEERITVSVRLPKATYKLLQKVATYYRTGGNMSHAVRRAIEDIAEGIEAGELFNRVKNGEVLTK